MKLRHLLVAITLLPAVAIGAILLSDRLFFGALRTAVELTSDYRLQVDTPVLRWHPLEFSSPLILLTHQRADAAPLFALQDVQLQGNLADWLRGASRGQLRIGNLSLYIDETSPSGRPDGNTVPQPLALVI